MKRIVISLFVFTIMLSYGCKDEFSFNDYEGSWSGTYQGADSGEWSATIDSDGKIVGRGYSDLLPAIPFNLSGNLEEGGKFRANTTILSQQITFNGQFLFTTVVGTFSTSDGTILGTWSGSKN